ncbi:MBL fold metallo-hydrolase [Micrococcales bacterium 31B]|nr:MBL fold metallo-hydrolase [Micrococcales bacterium 31B]
MHTSDHQPGEPTPRGYLDVIVSPVLAANCYVLIHPNGEALVVDPGFDVAEPVAKLLESRGVGLAAVLISHGHLDHVADIAPLVRAWGVPVVIGAGDAYRLENPVSQLPQPFIDMFKASRGEISWRAPGRVRELCADEVVDLGDWHLRSILAPGHTEGSTLYALDIPWADLEIGPGLIEVNGGSIAGPIADAAGLIFTGDVLFAGSIGRCDLHGGSEAVMRETLLSVISELPQTHAVLPGHGPTSRVDHELSTNPHLWSIR